MRLGRCSGVSFVWPLVCIQLGFMGTNESISINCLEMACVGVPSFVTMGGLHTWQDLESSQIFIGLH